jgi:CheY-like chemotaxis protein
MARCQRLGVAACVLKPVKQSELRDAIRMVMEPVDAGDDQTAGGLGRQRGRIAPLRVLLAEDSPVNQKLVTAVLERGGHRVTLANNGREAVAACQSQEFDLILMDVQMPEMDGLEAAAEIRARLRRRGARVPIIAMTAHVMPGDRHRCLEAGMEGYLAKPVRSGELYDMMAGVLDSAAPDPRSGPADRDAHQEVDWEKVKAETEGDEGLLRDLVETALDETAEHWRAIRDAVGRGDVARLRAAAHSLKGVVGYFGESAAGREVLRVEALVKENDFDPSSLLLAELERALDSLRGELTKYLHHRTHAADV